jgi:phosphoribosylformylglycinamidine cyclo-ligase
MHRTFNMGTGFVAALPAADAVDLARETHGRVIGSVKPAGGEGSAEADADADVDADDGGVVEIRGHRL